ncbi:MAG: CoA-transferase [Chloroflexota bacterium]|nr:CoA-transferase [Chloroflexota bacterium]
MSPATPVEVCIAAAAEAWRGDGEILATGIGLLPRIAASLARSTFSPDLLLTDGEALLLAEPMPLGNPAKKRIEGVMNYRLVFDMLWAGRRHIMMGASQIDRFGNTNISCIGDWSRPGAQLIGVRGAPGNSINHPCSFWIPNHSRRVFVEQVDMASGVGYDDRRWPEGAWRAFQEIRRVVTNLCVMDFKGRDHAPRLCSVHPGIAIDQVRESTGFDLEVPANVPETRLPTDEELRLIRQVLDPSNRREQERLG